MPVAALFGCEIVDAVCISENRIVAVAQYATFYSNDDKFISFTKDAVPAIQELQDPYFEWLRPQDPK